MPIATLLVSALLALLQGPSPSAPPHTAAAAADTVLAEFRAGRYWHASQILRDSGAASGSAADRLLLARAEAGWENWTAVAELLDAADWLDDVDGGFGWYLLGRAREEGRAWGGAAEAYERFASTPGPEELERIAVLARRARVLDHLDDVGATLAALDAIGAEPVASWMALELVGPAVERGDTARVLALLPRIRAEAPLAATWRLEADTRLAARDTAGAVETLRTAIAGRPGPQASATAQLGLLTLALGDTAEAKRLLGGVVDDARGPVAGDAAAALYEVSEGLDGERTLDFARILDRSGNGGRGLLAYDRARTLLQAEGRELPERDRVDRAGLMSTVPGRQNEALEEFRAIRETTTDERTGARNLEVWAQMRRRQGLPSHVSTLRRWLLEEWPASPEAAEVFWARGSAAESRGDVVGALANYEALERSGSSYVRAGEARMRMGQIHLGGGDPAAAAVVFDRYLADFPTGRRWDEAAYWAARAYLDLGDSTIADARIERIKRQDQLSYYAVIGDELFGRTYGVDLPEGAVPVEPDWLTDGLERIDVLGAAGLERAVDVEVQRLDRRAAAERPVRLRLAEALVQRGRTMAGIQIGWRLVDDGQGWDRRLAEVVFPFPYRELVASEAAEWGLDPMVIAALVRQESAFEAGIVSHAGAVGLMQVMPATGSELARRHGPRGFQAASLRVAEVNLHLGVAYFVEMQRRFPGDLPIVLTAYNAGPTRARRWERLPVASDPLRYTEYIPIEETRGYIKSVRRNVALYRALYGDAP